MGAFNMRTLYMITASMGGTVQGIELLSPESNAQAFDWARLPTGNALVLVVEPDTQVAGLLLALEVATSLAKAGHVRGNTGEPWLI